MKIDKSVEVLLRLDGFIPWENGTNPLDKCWFATNRPYSIEYGACQGKLAIWVKTTNRYAILCKNHSRSLIESHEWRRYE